MGEMVRLGVYRAGSDPMVEEAVRLVPKIETALGQAKGVQADIRESFDSLERILENPLGR
jgi:flagellum-specific ATP synthase